MLETTMIGRTGRYRLRFLLLALGVVSAFLMVACRSAAVATPDPASIPPGTPPGTLSPVLNPGASAIVVLAPIERVDIERLSDGPSQFYLSVVSGLRDGCESFGDARLSRNGATLAVSVTNLKRVGSDLVCAMVYGTVTTRLPLSGEFEVCKTYTVIGNGRPYAVQATAPDVECGPAGRPTSTPPVEGVRDVQVKVSDTVLVGLEDLEITLLHVTEDSRCPQDVVCVWAGEATIALNVHLRGRTLGEVNLTLSPDQRRLATATLGGYSIRLTQLDPYPVSASPIPQNEYAASLVVSEVSRE